MYVKPKAKRKRLSSVPRKEFVFSFLECSIEGRVATSEEPRTDREAEDTLKVCRLLVRPGDGIFVPCDCVGPCPLPGR